MGSLSTGIHALTTIESYLSAIMNLDNLINFKIILLSIVLEAFPFMLLSVMVSAFINNFITEQTIHRFLPQNTYLGIVAASVLGFLFPMCDCGIVPIVRRLVTKGVPLHTAIAFMLAAPIANPVVLAATLYAFKTNFYMVLLRLIIAVVIAILVAIFTSLCFSHNELKSTATPYHTCCSCSHVFEDKHDKKGIPANKLLNTMRDACTEFFEMGKYLLIGAACGSLAQILIPREFLLSIGHDSLLSVLTMMGFAFLISVCSAADAFIAASLSSSFSIGSLVAFMVLGPMLDIKNLLMLLHSFKLRFVLWILLLVTALCTWLSYTINYF